MPSPARSTGAEAGGAALLSEPAGAAGSRAITSSSVAGSSGVAASIGVGSPAGTSSSRERR